MIGGAQPPYRMPCGAIAGAQRFFLGSRYQHKKSAPFSIIKNTTKIQQPDGSFASPQTRLASVGRGGDCRPVGNPYINDANWFCDAWPQLFSNEDGTNIRVPANTFEATSSQVDYSTTHQYGFNIVQSMRTWHGSPGFLVDPDTLLYCNSGQPITSKFCSLMVEAVYTQNMTETVTETLTGAQNLTLTVTDTYTGEAKYVQSSSINPLSGEQTSTAPISTNNLIKTETRVTDPTDGGDYTDETPGYVTIGTGDENLIALPENSFNHVGADCNGNIFFGGGHQSGIDLGGISGALDDLADIAAEMSDDYFIYTITASVSASGIIAEIKKTATGKIDTTDFDEGTINVIHIHRVAQTIGEVKYKITYQFGAENSLSSVRDDARTLLGLWMLDNKNHFPQWRKDSNVTIAPLVCRNELKTPNVPTLGLPATVDDYSNPIPDSNGNAPFTPNWSPTWGQRDWYDPACYMWIFPYGENQNTAAGVLTKIIDGSIVGAPLPLGTGEAGFDSDGNITPRGCFDFNAVLYGDDYNPSGFGAWTPGYLPAHCSKWSDPYLSLLMWPTAFDATTLLTPNVGAGANADSTSHVVMQKWAEIKIPCRSHDFARPYGPDRTMVDWSLSRTEFSCPGEGNGTLTPSPPLRYPNCPGFGGRLPIKSISQSDGDSIAFEISSNGQTLTIQNGDRINFYAEDMTLLAANVSTTLNPDTTHLLITGAYDTLKNAKWITPYKLGENSDGRDGAEYWWADNSVKGDYVTCEFQIPDQNNPAPISSGAVQRCIGFTPCSPQVICYSPNGENFTNGITFPFPPSNSIGPFGVWLAVIEQMMIDPFFQWPLTCGEGVVIRQPSTLCTPPYVEARCELPHNGGPDQNGQAPGLPEDATDITLGPAMPYPVGGGISPWNIYDACGEQS